MSTLDDIRAHGHWEVVVRPIQFEKERIAFHELEPLVRNQAVQIRGWDFPHIDTHQDVIRGSDWIGQDFTWEDHREAWRFWQSGQFGYQSAFNIDWRGSVSRWVEVPKFVPGEALGVGETAIRYGEFLRFARGMALALPGRDSVFVRVIADGLKGRRLITDSPRRMRFQYERRSSLDQFVRETVMPRAELAARADGLAIEWARDLFQRFGWDASKEVMASLFQEFGWNAS